MSTQPRAVIPYIVWRFTDPSKPLTCRLFIRSPSAAPQPGPCSATPTTWRRRGLLLLGDAGAVRRQLHQAQRPHEHGQRHGQRHVSAGVVSAEGGVTVS